MGGFLCSRCRDKERDTNLRFDESDEESVLIDHKSNKMLSQSESESAKSEIIDVTFHHYDDICDEENLSKWQWSPEENSDDEIEELENRRSVDEQIKLVSTLIS